MGSKLSLFRRTVEIEEKQSEIVNNEVSSSELTKPTQPSEPTPISSETEKVAPNCHCVDCKCDPCNCTTKCISGHKPSEEAVIESIVEQISDKLQEVTLQPKEPEVIASLIEIPKPNESIQSPIEANVTINEQKPHELKEEAPKEEVPEEVKASHECCHSENRAEETPKEETHDKKCLCDPCECNPCKCCGQEEVIPNQGSEQPISQSSEPENSNPAEEEKRENEGQESQNRENESTETKNEENVAEGRQPIDENAETAPQEAALEVQTNE